MALANFFDKVNLSAAQRLRDYDRTSFEGKLLGQYIGIAFANNAALTGEGQRILDLLVRLLSRLYPNICFLPEGDAANALAVTLKELALQINPKIHLEFSKPLTAQIVVGEFTNDLSETPAFFIGSNNWTAHFSTTQQQCCGPTINPFGAGAAACFAAANLFRFVFQVELGGVCLDDQFQFSVYSQSINNNETVEPVLPEPIRLHFSLIGTGAIGNSALWTLLQLPQLTGRILLIDDQSVALSNLQRYVLALQEHVDHPKVDVLHSLFSQHHELDVVPKRYKWQQVISKLDDADLKVVATALDTKEDRFFVQSSLPKSILNAWTSPIGIGVSRHPDFTSGPCLACLYLPTNSGKKETQKIADALGMPEGEEFIHNYLSNRLPIDDAFVEQVYTHTGIPKGNLLPFVGQLVENLYSEGICGGKVIEVITGEVAQDMEVPLAHESAMAGILLAAEVVINNMKLRLKAIEPVTNLNLTDKIHPYLQEELDKHYSDNCICQDKYFVERYNEKWPASL